MSYKVYYSNPIQTAKMGFGKVAHLPCIFDNRPGYHRFGSEYLIERGLGLWSPAVRSGTKSVETTAPTPQTLKNYADWLANFLEWAERRSVDLLTCTYIDHIHGRYQKEMSDGVWSRDGAKLGSRTVNVRVGQACEFLDWMAHRGYRQPFNVATEIQTKTYGSATSSTGHRSVEVQVRIGKVKQKKRRLRMPKDRQVRAWLDNVGAAFGPTKQLMSETVLLSALRRSEIAGFRVDTLPFERSDWHINDTDAPKHEQQVLVAIKYGAKGGNFGHDRGDKIGPERDIWIPIDLAERLDEYRRKHRNPALKRWIKAAGSLSEQRSRIDNAVHLFLDEQTGERITGKQLYNAWTGVELPYKGWSPHLGRDWWACSILWQELRKHEALSKLGVDTAKQLIEATASSIIKLTIMPQLGHGHDTTSLIYLQWVTDMLSKGLSIRYEDDIDVDPYDEQLQEQL